MNERCLLKLPWPNVFKYMSLVDQLHFSSACKRFCSIWRRSITSLTSADRRSAQSLAGSTLALHWRALFRAAPLFPRAGSILGLVYRQDVSKLQHTFQAVCFNRKERGNVFLKKKFFFLIFFLKKSLKNYKLHT